MQVKDLPGQWNNSLLAKSPLWNREVQSLTPLDLSVFLRMHMGTALHYSARAQVDALLAKVWAAVTDGTVSPIPKMCFFAPPVERMTTGELRVWMERVSPARRNAILFALEMGLSVEEVVTLEWTQLAGLKLTDFAKQVLDQHPQHFRLPYVFWEVTDHAAVAPLLGLAESVKDVSDGRGWDALRELYRNLIPMDQDADMAHFLETLDIRMPTLRQSLFTRH